MQRNDLNLYSDTDRLHHTYATMLNKLRIRLYNFRFFLTNFITVIVFFYFMTFA